MVAMKVGIIQSNYIPWRGYFDFIDDVDLFIFYDDVSYGQGRKWRNRNKIKTSQGITWITVPINHKFKDQLICDTPIDYSSRWNIKHIKNFEQWYSKARFFTVYADELFGILKQRFETISALNISLCKWVMKKLDIKTPTCLSSEFQVQGAKTDRLLEILKKTGATCYLSGPLAKHYLDPRQFMEHEIHLEYKTYDYPPYPQLWGDFVGEVTVLDLLFNVGPDARQYLKSQSPNHVVVS